VPETGDIDDASKLIGKRVVTSFVGLTKQFFAKLEANGNRAYDTAHTQIKYVGGSVEAACALGVADGVVDLVGTIRNFRIWNNSRVWRDDEGRWVESNRDSYGYPSSFDFCLHLWNS
jgi:hypothetical protein